jgi:hypothetical protein
MLMNVLVLSSRVLQGGVGKRGRIFLGCWWCPPLVGCGGVCLVIMLCFSLHVCCKSSSAPSHQCVVKPVIVSYVLNNSVSIRSCQMGVRFRIGLALQRKNCCMLYQLLAVGLRLRICRITLFKKCWNNSRFLAGMSEG